MRTIKLLITLILLLTVWLMFCRLENISFVAYCFGCFTIGFIGSFIDDITKGEDKNV